MNSNKRNICRLCFKICNYNDSFHTMEEVTMEMLNYLLLNLDLAVSDDPGLCEGCVTDLKKCCSYKAACLAAVDCIENKNCRKHDVQNADQSNMTSEDAANAFDEYSLCSLCMKLREFGRFVCLKNEDMNLMVTLQKYFPELALSFTKDPVVCLPCYESLDHIFKFANNCLSAEDVIKEYSIIEGTNNKGQVDLHKVLEFTSKNMLKNRNACHFSYSNRTEKIRYEEEETTSDVARIKVKDFVGTAKEQELDIKEEEIKTEFGHGCSFKKSVLFLLPKEELENENRQKLLTITHQNTLDTAMYDCQLCTFKSISQSAIRSHALDHRYISEMKAYKCALCAFLTKYKCSLRNHMLTHEGASKVTMYGCNTCSYQTKLKHNLQTHMLTHKNSSEVTAYKCEICAYHTIHCPDLRRHMLIHKSASEVTMYKCDLCNFETKYKTNLRAHTRIHKSTIELARYKCKICEYETVRGSDLKKHTLTHKSASELSMYKCETCAYQAKRKHTLKTHMLLHKNATELTMYKCKMCAYQTKHKYNLQKHTSVHRVRCRNNV